MGVAVYRENQMHKRVYAGAEAGESFSRIIEAANRIGLLDGVDRHGDTMFNIVQLKRVDSEIEDLVRLHPKLAMDAQSVRSIIGKVIKDRGYLWISGD